MVFGSIDARAGERLIDDNLVTGAIDIGPAEAVRCRKTVDFTDGPGLAGIAIVMEYGNDTAAPLCRHLEAGSKNDFGDAIAVEVPGSEVDMPERLDAITWRSQVGFSNQTSSDMPLAKAATILPSWFMSTATTWYPPVVRSQWCVSAKRGGGAAFRDTAKNKGSRERTTSSV